ncbi:MAG: grhN [Acidimicrobiales bacterium]
MTTTVRDARPPATLVHVLNPIMRIVLRTRLGRLVRPFALLEFDGRRSGRRYRVPVGWHESNGGALVVTPAPWRINFSGGARATVYFRGKAQQMTGTLVTDHSAVAGALQSLFASGTKPREIGLDMPEGHRVTASDVGSVGRAAIQFHTCHSHGTDPAATSTSPTC